MNAGRTTEPVVNGSRSRVRNATRRDGVLLVSEVGGKYGQARSRAEAFEDRVVAELDGDRPTCVLDLVADGCEYTLEETGKELNLTRERVRQIEVKALLRLRDDHTNDMLEEAKGMAEAPDPHEGSPW